MKSLVILLALLQLLSGCTVQPQHSAGPAPDLYAWLGDYDGKEAHATVAGLAHMPLDQLPQEVRDGLELAEEDHCDGFYNEEWCIRRTYTAPTQVYLDYLAEVDKDNRELYPVEEDFWANVEGEEGREWIIRAVITDDSYETLYGLKVGQTVEEAAALGYPLEQQTDFGPGPVTCLQVTVEDGAITEMQTWWGMGRYIGKFFEL